MHVNLGSIVMTGSKSSLLTCGHMCCSLVDVGSRGWCLWLSVWAQLLNETGQWSQGRWGLCVYLPVAGVCSLSSHLSLAQGTGEGHIAHSFLHSERCVALGVLLCFCVCIGAVGRGVYALCFQTPFNSLSSLPSHLHSPFLPPLSLSLSLSASLPL